MTRESGEFFLGLSDELSKGISHLRFLIAPDRVLEHFVGLHEERLDTLRLEVTDRCLFGEDFGAVEQIGPREGPINVVHVLTHRELLTGAVHEESIKNLGVGELWMLN